LRIFAEDLNQRERWNVRWRWERLCRIHFAKKLQPQAPAPIHEEGALSGPVGRGFVNPGQLNHAQEKSTELRTLEQVSIVCALFVGDCHANIASV
jgi:hypothetical protein